MNKIGILLFITLILFASLHISSSYFADKPEAIAASPQRSGDAKKGYDYLITGDYVKSGIPLNLYKLSTPKDTNNFLQRLGNNKTISHDLTALLAPNGEWIVAPNCLQCHAQLLDGKLVVGLGNSLADFTSSQEIPALFAEKLLKKKSGEQTPRYEAAKNFITTVKTVAAKLVVPIKGVNIADGLAAILASHRDPGTFKWTDNEILALPKEMIPTDVPAWWLLKKKHAMFYNGFGRGDFGRFLMASNLLTVTDTSESREVDGHISDVLAFINSIEPPKYPKTIDADLATAGKPIFDLYCSGCHGMDGKYPNLLIPASIIKTDAALYSANFSNPQFVDWFNKSWFTKGDHPAKLVPTKGYIAPPLDGVWITAPYLHNGSVPDLETLLNSKARPSYWQRSFSKPEYNFEIPGWKYETKTVAGPTDVYNTKLKGYSNAGHDFGDVLSAKERRQVIEYLKTL